MGKEVLYYLDAETVSDEYRVTSFSFYMEDLMQDFGSWLADRGLVFSDMKYATIYRAADREPVADLINDEGQVLLQPRIPNNSLLHRLVLWFRRRINT